MDKNKLYQDLFRSFVSVHDHLKKKGIAQDATVLFWNSLKNDPEMGIPEMSLGIRWLSKWKINYKK